MTTSIQEEIVYPDGRHALTLEADTALDGSPLHNVDLAPVPIEKRTWTTYNYIALWIGMAHNIHLPGFFLSPLISRFATHGLRYITTPTTITMPASSAAAKRLAGSREIFEFKPICSKASYWC